MPFSKYLVEDLYMEYSHQIGEICLEFSQWIHDNCYASREGWRSSSVPIKWKGEITNEAAYEMYLESLK